MGIIEVGMTKEQLVENGYKFLTYSINEDFDCDCDEPTPYETWVASWGDFADLIDGIVVSVS